MATCIDSDTVWGTAARVATARGADECGAGECGADERGAGKSDAGCDGVGCNVAGRAQEYGARRAMRHESTGGSPSGAWDAAQPDVGEPHTVGHVDLMSLLPTTSMVESVGLVSVVPGSAVPETCSVMGRNVGAGAQAWADGWAQGMEGEKHGCCMRWVGT